MSADSLLTDLCTICHLNPPKYRCPRCSTRTCSLPCTRRHKLWSQCSGVRDPAAYLRRNELATESAFDRDFNFITGIERRLERAGRDAENRGVNVSEGARYADLAVVGLDDEQTTSGDGGEEGRKRKRGGGGGGDGKLAKGEAGFLRRAQDAGVKVIRAPKGMSRSKVNGSKWNQRNKFMSWTVEWAIENEGKKFRNCPETWTIADAFDNVYPLTKEEKEKKSEERKTQEQTRASVSGSEPSQEQVDKSLEERTSPQPTANSAGSPSTPALNASEETGDSKTENITPHRDFYFYLHRPRTTTKQPVLTPLVPDMTLSAALRNRLVLEFPTVYVLRDVLHEDGSTEDSKAKYILEKDYLRVHDNSEPEVDEVTTTIDLNNQTLPGSVDIGGIDEGTVLEVLKKDLFETAQ